MELQNFKNDLFELVVKAENGENLFDVETVARSLGFVEKKKAKEYVRWRTVNGFLKKYLSQDVAKGDFISEPMVYKLAFKANNETAEKFQDWLAVEVLPSIRKHGMYAKEELLDNPDLLIEVATQLKEERNKNELLEQQIAEYEPKISYLDMILSSSDTVATSQIAADYGMSAIALNRILNDLGVQRKVSGQWLLYKHHMNNGYTKSHTSEIRKSDGSKKVVMNTKWTQKGRIFIYDLLKQNGHYPQMDLDDIA